jgi:hypothetical protein
MSLSPVEALPQITGAENNLEKHKMYGTLTEPTKLSRRIKKVWVQTEYWMRVRNERKQA